MDISTSQIVPRETWQTFFDEWSRAHAGKLITLSGFPDGPDWKHESPRLRLVGISLDPRGSESGHLIIMLGDTLEDNREHILPDVIEVRARSEAAVMDWSYLELARADGTTVTVQAGDP